MRTFVLVAAAALVASGCERSSSIQSEPPPAVGGAEVAAFEPVTGFSHQAGQDLRGFHLPVTEVQVGDLRLSHIYIGSDAEFEDWEATQGEGADLFAPVMVQFDDTTSSTIPNDYGGQGYAVSVRVMPTGYAVTRGRITRDGKRVAEAELRFRTVPFPSPELCRRTREAMDRVGMR